MKELNYFAPFFVNLIIMSKLSANRLLVVWKDGLTRFPITNIFGFLATLLLIFGNEFDWQKISYWGPGVFTVYLGIPLFFAIELKGESFQDSIKKSVFLISGLLLLGLIFFDINGGGLESLQDGIRIAGYAVILHLMVSFWPVQNSKNDNARRLIRELPFAPLSR